MSELYDSGHRKGLDRTAFWVLVVVLLAVAGLSALLMWLITGWSFTASLVICLLMWAVVGRYIFVIIEIYFTRKLTRYQLTEVDVNQSGKYFRDRLWRAHRFLAYDDDMPVRRKQRRGVIERRLLSFVIETGANGLPENQVVLMMRFHWWQEVRKPQFWVLVIFAVILLVVAIRRLIYGQGDWDFPWWVILLEEIIPLGLLWLQTAEWRYRYLMATNLRCIVLTAAPLLLEPFMRSTLAPVDWTKVTIVKPSHSPMGSFMGYGTLDVDTPAQKDVDFHDLDFVPHVYEVYQLLEETRRNAVSNT